MNPELQPALDAVIESLMTMDEDDFERLALAVAKECERRTDAAIADLCAKRS